MQVAILVAGGVGTLLAAVGAELWVALTTALATALTTWLASHQLDETLVRYNQSAADLANVRDWWTKLSPAAKRNPKNIEQLVDVTEKVLKTELTGWVQRMENALAQLRLKKRRATSQVAISRSRKTKAHHHHRNLMLSRRKNPLILRDSKLPSRLDVPHSSPPAVSASEGL